MEKCPCIDCVLIAICKYKTFIEVQNECSLLEHHLYIDMVDSNHVFSKKRADFNERVKEVHDTLIPTRWDIINKIGILNISDPDSDPYLALHKHKEKRTFYE